MDILVLNKKDIEEAITMTDAIDADKDALALYSSNKSNIPLRVNISVPENEGQALFMPGYAGDGMGLGIKIVSVYPNNINLGKSSVPASMILIDEKTGEVKSILDGTYLTQLRTGALSGAATDVLAKKDAEIFLIIGTGGQAKSQVEAVLSVRKIKKIYVADIDQKRAKEFSDYIMNEYNIDVEAVKNPNEVVGNADIITLVTTAKNPVFDASNLKNGVHINSVGSYTREMQETPVEVLLKADKIFLDTIDGVINESGDVILPLEKGVITKEKICHELGNIINGKKKAEKMMMKLHGLKLLDLLFLIL